MPVTPKQRKYALNVIRDLGTGAFSTEGWGNNCTEGGAALCLRLGIDRLEAEAILREVIGPERVATLGLEEPDPNATRVPLDFP